MSLATLKKKSNSKFNKISQSNFNINGTIRNSTYIGRGSTTNYPSHLCESTSNNIKTSVKSGFFMTQRKLIPSKRPYPLSVVQPDSNFPGNDSQGIYIFNKKIKNNCVNSNNNNTIECKNIPSQNCKQFIGSTKRVTTQITKDEKVFKSHEDYLHKKLVPACTQIITYPPKFNNITATNARCGSHL